MTAPSAARHRPGRLGDRRGRLGWATAGALFVLAIVWSGWLARHQLEGRASLLDRIETTTLDWRVAVAGRLPPPPGVAIVAIDDAAVATAGGYPLPRRAVAGIVDTIRRSGARGLAIDILFAGPGGEGDAALGAALGRLPSVIAAAASFDKDVSSLVPQAADVLAPEAAFAPPARVGLVNVSADAGGTPREMPLLVLTPKGPMPSIVLVAAGLGEAGAPSLEAESVRLGAVRRRLDLGWHLPLRFYGPAGGIPTFGAARLLAGEPEPLLAGRLVFLGVTATAIGDSFATPFDPKMPGVEVLATGTANLLDGTGLARDTAVRRTDAAAAVLLAACAVLAIALLPLATGLAVAAAALVGWLAVTVFAVSQGIWLAAALPVAAMLPPAAAASALRLRHDRRRAEIFAAAETALRRFQPRALAVRIAESPDFLMVPETRKVAILFVDLAGFTGMSERIGAARTRDVLKEFHTLVVEELVPRSGVVLNFMGDGAMVVFGLPDRTDADATNAVAASLAVVATVRRWIFETATETKLGGVRLGAHYGPVVLSRLGHDEEQHITATGDSVNVASRLMEVAKARDASVAISQALWQAADTAGMQGPDRWEVVAIRGREEALTVGLWR
ncbi:CHASE2 domain-containing protein [Jiella sonneratiae]|uniref:Adenylate/guanylate cyclase domain-containing protein n=1 Tax=Jiella sonneratiae TaxID=2816856 RepID=A0ABS3IZK2_9HYPH|nr:adenylate/guanylate cyclase domain-containing protein [Jiella sonneratiae]